MNFAIIAIAVHIALFLICIYFIATGRGNTRIQKLLQSIIGLLVPFIGPAWLIIFHIADRKKTAPSDRYMGQSVDEYRGPLSHP